MSTLGLLGYNSAYVGGNATKFANTTINFMNTMPALVNSWQFTDIQNNNTGGYFQNPVAAVAQSISDTSNIILEVCKIISGLDSINAAAAYIITSAQNFIAHTNRLSGVVTVLQDSLTTLPHYSEAVSTGKTILYIMNKNEDSSNNASIIGNFTSLFIENELNNMSITITNDLATINASKTPSYDSDTDTFSYTSSLTPTQIENITNDISSISTLMDSRVNNDVTFFQNSQAYVKQYNSVRQFNNMGGTETDLINNYIGSPKLLSRLNG
jgi:hypothetical protein